MQRCAHRILYICTYVRIYTLGHSCVYIYIRVSVECTEWYTNDPSQSRGQGHGHPKIRLALPEALTLVRVHVRVPPLSRSLSLFLLFLSFLVSPPSSSLSFASLPFNGSHSLRSYILCALPADSRIAILSRKRERERDERRNFDYDRKICRTIDRFRSVSVSSRGGDAFESIRRKVSAK